MENKRHVVEAFAFVLLLVCAIVIWINVSLKAQRSAERLPFEKFKTVALLPIDSATIEWEDNFDSSYIEPTTGCLYLTHKK